MCIFLVSKAKESMSLSGLTHMKLTRPMMRPKEAQGNWRTHKEPSVLLAFAVSRVLMHSLQATAPYHNSTKAYETKSLQSLQRLINLTFNLQNHELLLHDSTSLCHSVICSVKLIGYCSKQTKTDQTTPSTLPPLGHIKQRISSCETMLSVAYQKRAMSD